MTDLVTWVCAECDDPDVYSDWECQWDNELQLWVGKNEHSGQEFYCDNCYTDSGLSVHITERPLNLKEIAQVAIKKQEIINASNAQ
jgi:hypothetical protein